MAFNIDSKPVEVLHEILEKKYQGVLDQAVALQKPEFQSSFFSATIRAFSEDSFSSITSIISQRFPELSNPKDRKFKPFSAFFPCGGRGENIEKGLN